jgi:GNAT superfamily N-acetyltransferase
MIHIRPADAGDVPLILSFIRELAGYEHEPEAVVAAEADLLRDGFGESPVFRVLIAEYDGIPAGMALFLYNYSTWVGRRGLFVEDLYVRPALRGKGLGRALLARVAQLALEEKCGRLQWCVLDWNQPSINFYQKIGGHMIPEWLNMRIAGEGIAELAKSWHEPERP